MFVHNEKAYECDTESFQDFLVATPLQVKYIPCPCLILSKFSNLYRTSRFLWLPDNGSQNLVTFIAHLRGHFGFYINSPRFFL